MAELGLDGLIAIGGEDTLGAANRLHAEHGLNVVGVPKTIDNDIGATDVTFGFDTALQVATEAIDRLHTTAESHHRVMVVEVMGRHAGWIALYSGIAGGGDVILIPEQPFDIEQVCGLIRRRHARGRFFSIVVVAEGAMPKEGTMELAGGETDEFGHVRLGGIGQRLEQEIEAADRVRDPRRRPRPHPARRDADRLRPGARDALRGRARSTPPTRGAGGRCRRCAGRGSSSSRWPRRSPSCARSRPRSSRLPKRSWASARSPRPR